ncbi:hypothetical protein FH972_026960 [Carpinus fangiana]|uniref:Uncharacterized protein n=1 Tax=Carpinus fangiana TaxID=176857 RepID=A0A5N6L6B8_9ROSI|nr:hypothetical protein FH972_026960 [Carpinus fangiana]
MQEGTSVSQHLDKMEKIFKEFVAAEAEKRFEQQSEKTNAAQKNMFQKKNKHKVIAAVASTGKVGRLVWCRSALGKKGKLGLESSFAYRLCLEKKSVFLPSRPFPSRGRAPLVAGGSKSLVGTAHAPPMESDASVPKAVSDDVEVCAIQSDVTTGLGLLEPEGSPPPSHLSIGQDLTEPSTASPDQNPLGRLAVGSVERYYYRLALVLRKVPSQNPKKVKNKSSSPPSRGRRR